MSRARLGESESRGGIATLRAVQKARNSHPLPQRLGEMYGEDGMLKSEYHEHQPAERAILRFHARSNGHLPEVTLTPGMRQAIKLEITHPQIVRRYPWAVMWVRMKDGRRVRGEKRFTSLGAAIGFWARVKPTIATASVVSRVRSYHVPAAYRGRIPKPYCWCPRCMQPRKYKPDYDRTFWVVKKRWTGQKFEWVETQVIYLVCPICRTNNRDPVWRQSNQPWEKRRVKDAARRVKPKTTRTVKRRRG